MRFPGRPQQSAADWGLKTTDLFSRSSRGQKSEIKVLAGLHPLQRLEGRVLPASSSFWGLRALLSLWQHHSNPCLLSHVPLLCVSYKDLCHWVYLGPPR